MSELKNMLKEAKEWLDVVDILSEEETLINHLRKQLTQKDELLEEACRLIGNHHIKGKEESEFLRKVKDMNLP